MTLNTSHSRIVSQMTHFVTVAVMATYTLALSGCVMAVAAAGNSFDNAVADKKCTQVPVFVAPAPVVVESVLLGSYIDHDRERDNSLLPLNFLASNSEDSEYGAPIPFAMLGAELQTGWSYLEVESPGRDGPAMQRFLEIGGAADKKFIRFALAEQGDPACAQFQRAVDAPYGKQILNSVPVGQCVASYAEQAASSAYELRVVDLPDDRVFKPQFSEQPALWQIIDRRTGTVYAQLQRRMNVYSRCPQLEVRREFVDVLQPRLRLTKIKMRRV